MRALPEAVECGAVKLVGTKTQRILFECEQLLDRPEVYRSMAQGVSPYGDGEAASRIVRVLESALVPAQVRDKKPTALAA